MKMAGTFPADIVTRAIKSCRNSKAFGHDKLSIFHLKILRPREYITAIFNLSVTNCQILAIWKSSLIIPIPNPGKDTSQGSSYQPISLLCPAAKVMETLILPTINKYILPAPDQHGFRQEHSTTSALLQLTTDIAMGFNQRKPPDRTVYVTVDLSAAFDTVFITTCCPRLTEHIFPWLHRDGYPAMSSQDLHQRCSPSRKVNTGVPQ